MKGINVFDIDGTLTDSVKTHQVAFEATLRSFEFPALRTDWNSYKHHSDSAIFEEAWEEAGFVGCADIEELEARFLKTYDQVATAIPFAPIRGSREFVEHVRGEGWVPVFATGSLRHGALHKLRCLGLDGEAEILVTASERRTREQIVRAAVEKANNGAIREQSKRVISFGDGIWDLRTARNLNYEFIGIGNGESTYSLISEDAIVFEDFEIFMRSDFAARCLS